VGVDPGGIVDGGDGRWWWQTQLTDGGSGGIEVMNVEDDSSDGKGRDVAQWRHVSGDGIIHGSKLWLSILRRTNSNRP